MADFLLELRCEEIPARMQAGARAELEKLFRRELEAAGVKHDNLRIWSTPRRLALIAYDLPAATEAVSEEAKGPPEGAPDAAIDGFCKKAGVTRESLELRDVKGRMTYFAVIEQPGRAMAEVLSAAIPAIIRDFSWPKSMRWGAASITTDSIRWVRPLSGIVALLDGAVIDFEFGGIRSGRETMGHRFHHSGPVAIESAHTYAGQLLDARVIVEHTKREALIRQGAADVAAAAGLTLVADEGLVIENAGLTENPVPLLGRFDEAFLDVPPEVIQLTARVNQKYFVCEDADGKLANAFVCTANIDPLDPAVVVDGNRKVLAARLSDARFFWEQDQKTPLAEHAKKLARITFHEKLGTVADKVERVAKLARWLCEEGIVAGDPDLAEQAARLCKADLVTEMVGEFPELQGLMGGYYAAKEGLPVEVSDAIRDHYKPVGQGDDVPTAPVTVAVSLADKLDTLAGFFFHKLQPTGSKDPFALRRAALSCSALLATNDLRIGSRQLAIVALDQIADFKLDSDIARSLSVVEREFHWQMKENTESFKYFKSDGVGYFIGRDQVKYAFSQTDFQDYDLLRSSAEGRARHAYDELMDYIEFRFNNYLQDSGASIGIVSAVEEVASFFGVRRRLLAALQSFIDSEDGTNLFAGYKRAANILKKENYPVTPASAGMTGEHDGIEQTGEEDPLAMVDDPEIGDFVAEQAHALSGLSYTPEKAEKALIDALDSAEPAVRGAIESEDFDHAMRVLASLRAPIDRFFEEVTVNDPNADKRSARLALLARFRDAVHRVADFSRIEG